MEPESDRYLGVVFVCSICLIRLRDCACDETTRGWDNRMVGSLDYDLYLMAHPPVRPQRFVSILDCMGD